MHFPLPALALAALILPALAPAQAPDVPGSNNAFATDLYGQLKTGTDNVFFAPISVSAALAMTAQGAKGPTLEEMNKVLHLGGKPEQIADGFAQLETALVQAANKSVALATANAIWPAKGEAFVPEFLATLEKSFGAKAEQLDYVKDAEGARKTINTWVEKQTNDKIKDLLPKGSVDGSTALVLTNAIYFKGAWQTKFDPKATVEGDFATLAGKSVKAPLMHAVAKFTYLENDTCQAVVLPYAKEFKDDGRPQGPDLAMLVLLPKKPATNPARMAPPTQTLGLADLEKALTANYLATMLTGAAPRKVNLTLPKWKTTRAVALNKPLQALGMKTAFTGAADFSGMMTHQKLFISLVQHQAFVEVNEEGTEAAGATAVVMTKTSAVREDPPVAFTADRPFVYAIVHVPTKTVLFLGRLADPTK